MGEEKKSSAIGILSAIRSWPKTLFKKISWTKTDGSHLQKSLIGVLVAANMLIYITVPVLIVLPNGDISNELSTYSRMHQSTQDKYQNENQNKRSTGDDPKDLVFGVGKSYQIEGPSSSIIGVDVSDHQGSIDWLAVSRTQVEFVFVKVGARGYTEGGIIPDKRFEENFKGAKNAGLKVGVYFFSQSINEEEAREEADYVLKILNGRNLDYPVVYDFETVASSDGRANDLSSEQRSLNARVFCEQIESAGYSSMIYGNPGDMVYYEQTLIQEYPIWHAEYEVSTPRALYPIEIWQFTSSGVIDGISTRVDLNVHFQPDTPRQLPENIVIH